MGSIMLEDAAIRRAIKSLETAMNGILDINKSMTDKTNRLFDCWEGDSKSEFEKEYNGAFNGTKLKDVEIALSSINRINKGRNQKLADMKSLAERISNSID